MWRPKCLIDFYRVRDADRTGEWECEHTAWSYRQLRCRTSTDESRSWSRGEWRHISHIPSHVIQCLRSSWRHKWSYFSERCQHYRSGLILNVRIQDYLKTTSRNNLKSVKHRWARLSHTHIMMTSYVVVWYYVIVQVRQTINKLKEKFEENLRDRDDVNNRKLEKMTKEKEAGA